MKRTLPTILVFGAVVLCGRMVQAADPTELPRLAQLKLAAEAGDAIAQYRYSYAAGMKPEEKFEWRMRSAEQGYPPAQNVIGVHFTGPFSRPRRNAPGEDREAVRWTSRAAYNRYPAAQLRLSQFYMYGTALDPDPVAAYMWVQLAIQNSDSSAGERIAASLQRDQLIANITSEQIAEGQRRAAIFTYPPRGEMNPIELQLLVAQMKISGVFQVQDQILTAVNGVKFKVGDKKEIKVDAHTVELECASIGPKHAIFKVGGFDTVIQLTTK